MCCGGSGGGGGGAGGAGAVYVTLTPPQINVQGNVPLGALPTPPGGWPGLPAPTTLAAQKATTPGANGAVSTAARMSPWPLLLIGGLLVLAAGSSRRRRKRRGS